MTVLLGVVYPLFIAGIAQVCFPDKANGSLIEKNGKIIGSMLVGQQFDSAAYFSSRPSATGYSTLPSGASNLGLTSRKLYDQVKERKEAFIVRNGISPSRKIPSEMLFASASGLDPHISPEAATLQINRIAKTRKFSDQQKWKLQSLVEEMTEKPQFNLFGESRINVLLLNLRLDEMK